MDYEEKFRQCDSRKLGFMGEALWSSIFRDAGMNYIQLCGKGGSGAPMLEGKDKIILPDFDVFSMHMNVYADSKAKKGPVLFRIAGEWRHGIDRKNFEHYGAISEAHRKHCLLAIFECFQDEENPRVWSGALLAQSLESLGKPQGGMNSQAHMVYWPRKKFSEIGHISAYDSVRLCNCAPDDTMPKFKRELRELLESTVEKPVQGRMF